MVLKANDFIHRKLPGYCHQFNRSFLFSIPIDTRIKIKAFQLVLVMLPLVYGSGLIPNETTRNSIVDNILFL